MSSESVRTPVLQTKLPAVGTTIFTVMSALATEKGAVNLGQGFPDFDCDPQLVNAVTDAMTRGLNQYPPMTGVPALREAIAAKLVAVYGRAYDAGAEITVTAGATQAIITAILAVVRPGDEVIVLEPCYDSYVPAAVLNGGVPKVVPLEPRSYAIDWDAVRRAVTGRTRLLMLNSPHNPAGSVITRDDIRALQSLVGDTGIYVVSDEV
ncbi:MAG TPA: aminotransferase class I/II-fold pyridoxal phosphate-dependent enzyme, partial [Ramlibacter sp.]|nr:aminotransferase class I/II-fold pyridoxal phosphate-dependent enzyme [Ramlibacter sp.]